MILYYYIYQLRWTKVLSYMYKMDSLNVKCDTCQDGGFIGLEEYCDCAKGKLYKSEADIRNQLAAEEEIDKYIMSELKDEITTSEIVEITQLELEEHYECIVTANSFRDASK